MVSGYSTQIFKTRIPQKGMSQLPVSASIIKESKVHVKNDKVIVS